MSKLIFLAILLTIAISGCNKSNYVDIGPVLVDKQILPDNVKVEK